MFEVPIYAHEFVNYQMLVNFHHVGLSIFEISLEGLLYVCIVLVA
jgi:hypothetical protein